MSSRAFIPAEREGNFTGNGRGGKQVRRERDGAQTPKVE